MRKNILYLIGFILLASFYIFWSYLEVRAFEVRENVLKALFITLFIKAGLWLQDKIEADRQCKGKAGDC